MKKETWYKILYCILRPITYLVYPMKVYGLENVPEGPAILCADHSNAVDPALISFALTRKVYIHHLAKAEARKIPVFGWLMKKMGSIFVRRGESDITAFKDCIRVMKNGEKLLLFPEGTRVHGDEKVEPKSGVIHMSVRLRVPVVPVYLPRDKKAFRTTYAVFGEAYVPEVAGRDDYERAAADLMDRIWALKR